MSTATRSTTCFRTAIAALLASAIGAQDPAPGLRIYQAYRSDETVLVDTTGAVAHTWEGLLPGVSAHIESSGSLLRSALTGLSLPNGVTGAIQRISFDGELLWDFRFEGPVSAAHHDIHPMPDGNVLLIAWDLLTVADAIAAGRDPASVGGAAFMPDAIYEVQPTGLTTGEVVWEWHVWDHLIQDFDPTKANYGVVADHPELVDINYPPGLLTTGDWNHANGIDYDPVHDLIVLSAPVQDEIWIIDHSTTTAEAAGHTGGRLGRGGDLVWRWGNPAAYRRGTADDQQLFAQHDPRFVPRDFPGGGNVTVFNNGVTATTSAVFELELPLRADGTFAPIGQGAHGPALPVWSYTQPLFGSAIMSSAQRLPNGNTLICSSTQRTVFEVTAEGEVVWLYTEPTAGVFLFQAHHVDRELWSSDAVLSAGAGGQVDFFHVAGADRAGQTCLLLGSASGTAPGISVAGVALPLVPDFLFAAMAGSPNSGMFVNTLRRLDMAGRSSSALVAAPGLIPPGLVGLELHLAHLTFDATALTATGASNPVPLSIVP